jgi:lipoate-protein ligase A
MMPETIANALAQGFKAILKIQLVEDELTPNELETAKSSTKKILTKEWNFSGKNRLSLLMPPTPEQNLREQSS